MFWYEYRNSICSDNYNFVLKFKEYEEMAKIRREAYNEELKKFNDSLTEEQKKKLKESKQQKKEDKEKRKKRRELLKVFPSYF